MHAKILKKLMLSGLLFSAAALSAADSLLKIPYKQDPPIMVDGNLDDWSDVPGRIALNGSENLLSGSKPQPAVSDLSGEFAFCWKPDGLYVAANVTDNKLLQRGFGMDIFQGDHIELFLDVKPMEKDAGTLFGKKQFQLGISPGNFSTIKPEIVSAWPNGLGLSGTRCAAMRKNDGWTLEVYLPWKIFGEQKIELNQVIGLTAWISDTDADTGNVLRPSWILTTGDVHAKFRDRRSLMPAVFTDATGKHSAVISRFEPVEIVQKVSIEPNSRQDFKFDMGKNPFAYLVPVLHLRANLRTTHEFSGYAHVMQIFVNGQEVDQRRLLKPENEFRAAAGNKGSTYQKGRGFLVPYTKDGKAGNLPKNTLRFFLSHRDLHDFAFDLGGLLKPGENTITVRNQLASKFKRALELSDVRISFESVEKKAERKAAPTGKLPVMNLKPSIPLTGKINSSGCTFEIKQKNGNWIVKSRFSTPDGKWASGSSSCFRHRREVERKSELLVVTDRFTNLTNENLPLIQEHKITADSKKSELYLGGVEYTSGRNIRRSIGNFSVFAGNGTGGVGLYAVNPEFQIHSGAFIPEPHTAVLCDDQTVIPPGGEAVRQFVLVPLEKGSYYDFVNVTRRHLGVNVRLEGPCGAWSSGKWMTAYIDRLNIYNIHYLIVELPKIGRSFLTSPDIPRLKNMIAGIRKTRPSVKVLRYYHSQIESDPEAPWTEGKVLLKNGKQALYGGGNSRIFLNLEGTAYSKMMEQVLDDLLENWDIDGIYWDEFNACSTAFHYGAPWDQCSGDINPFTHKITRLKSSVFLLQRPWKNRMADKILAKGKILYTNGGAARMGEFAAKVRFTFTETDQDANNTRVHFSTPLSHANQENLSKVKFEYYEKFLRALDYGCVFNYSFISMPIYGEVYHTFTDHLYPLTPLELHPGYIIARERIVTNRSGMFGWEDASKHEIHVYDHEGREVRDHKLKTVSVDGRIWSEIRLPEDWSAIIVRK